MPIKCIGSFNLWIGQSLSSIELTCIPIQCSYYSYSPPKDIWINPDFSIHITTNDLCSTKSSIKIHSDPNSGISHNQLIPNTQLFQIPIKSLVTIKNSKSAIPIQSTKSTIPIQSLKSTIPSQSPTSAIPVQSLKSTIPIQSLKSSIPVQSLKSTITVESPKSTITIQSSIPKQISIQTSPKIQPVIKPHRYGNPTKGITHTKTKESFAKESFTKESLTKDKYSSTSIFQRTTSGTPN